jgi:hypothetical protein
MIGIGNFLVTSWTPTSITFYCTGNNNPGLHISASLEQPLILELQALAPPVPQPPIIVPAGPPTVIPAPAPFYQGCCDPLFTPNGPDSFSPNGTPYGICVIGGHVIAFDPDFNTPPQDLSEISGYYFKSPLAPRCYFEQAERWLVIQVGDYDPSTGNGSLPLFWDGFNLTQSNGLTGVLVVGEPEAATFEMTIGATAWIPNNTVGDTSNIILTEPYPGNLGDNILIYNSTPVNLGTYQVTQINGNTITVTTLSVSGTPSSTSGTLSCEYTTPLTPSQTVTIGIGQFTIPSVAGQNVTLSLTSLYPGSVGDTIDLWDEGGVNNYGTYQVVSFNSSFSLVLKLISAGAAQYGTTFTITTFAVEITSVRSFTQKITPNGAEGNGSAWVVPSVGNVSNRIYWPAFDGSYSGKLYDVVQIVFTASNTPIGTFRVVADGNYYNADHSFPYIELEALAISNQSFVGNSYTDELTFTMASPPTNTGTSWETEQLITISTGSWTVPQVGSTVQLQLVWNGLSDTPPEGPSYPGSVGDTVTLLQNSPVLNIGTFLVKSFDTTGNITLQTVSTDYAGTAFNTISATMEITQPPSITGTSVSQIPSATCMSYYQGILWYAQGDVINGGDVVGGPAGTSANKYLDSVLCVTENAAALGGDGFKLPILGNITGMAWPAQINASLGQGLLYIGTINGICSLQVPSNRTNWISLNSSNPPQMNVVQDNSGPVNDWCFVKINGDLYYQSTEPSIRSLILAQRYFQQWGNLDISNNEQRIWDFTDNELLSFVSGQYFNKRLMMTALPSQTSYGMVHAAIIPMDMTPIDTFEELSTPNWEGMHEGLQVFQLVSGIFNGKQRTFAITLNQTNAGEIDLWENTPTEYFDNGDTPIQWQAETPAHIWGSMKELKELLGGELWIDQIVGKVFVKVEWRPDFATCWSFWDEWTECFAETSLSVPTIKNPSPYPVTLPPGYKNHSLPRPPDKMQAETGRPAALGYQHQFRLTITGQCRVRGFVAHAQIVSKNIYES